MWLHAVTRIMKKVNASPSEQSKIMKAFGQPNELWIFEISFGIEVWKYLKSTRRFKMSKNEHYINIWKTK